MSKAYDGVEWSFLERIMRKMGFAEQWIAVVMECVKSVSYRVKCNRKLQDPFIPERGLRQGDPLSPYLFILCAEGLSALLHSAEEDGSLQGVQLCTGAPKINHLFFADDSLIIMKANASSAAKLQNILAMYEAHSGQMINKEKSSAMFSKGTTRGAKQAVLGVLGIPRESHNERYLGLPVHLGASKSKEFEYLKERIWQRIQGWKERLLSKAGKEIMIKAVAQAIPTYAMSCFDLTKTLCEDISAMICRYWWSQTDEKNKCHWIGWDKMTRSKQDGGMGFRDLHIFNLAMLARQSWRLLQNPDSLCCTVLKALYFPDTSILQAEPRPGMSYTWRSVLRGLELLKEGIVWRVGTGEQIDVYKDPWLPRGQTKRVRSPDELGEELRVSDLIDTSTGQWDEELIRNLFDQVDTKEILSIPIRPGMVDTIAWHFDNKGIFSVKSCYHLGVSLRDHKLGKDASSSTATKDQSPIWNMIWNLKLPGKVRIFLWRLCHNSLPTRVNIKRKKVELDTRCPMCYRLDEDGGHLFIKCNKVRAVWRMLLLEDVRLDLEAAASPLLMVETILSLPKEKQITTCVLLWDWWTTRNKINAGEQERSIDVVCNTIQKHVISFQNLLTPSAVAVDAATEPEPPDKRWWRKPARDHVKVNFDAAFWEPSGTGAWGFVVRNEEGEFVAAAAGKLRHLRNALQAEAEACVAATEGAVALGLNRVIFESDSKTLVDALNSDRHKLSEIGVLLRESRSNCIAELETFSFQFCSRVCNKVAHAIAKFGSQAELECVGWDDAAPGFVSELVASEAAEHYG